MKNMSLNRALKILLKASEHRLGDLAVNASMNYLGCDSPGCQNARKEYGQIAMAQLVIQNHLDDKKQGGTKKNRLIEGKQMRLM